MRCQYIAAVMVVVFVLFCASCAVAKTIYVKWNSPGPTFDGSSWNNAYRTISAATAAAKSGDQIWVARGTYGSANVPAGVALYGGFVGTEALLSQRPAFQRAQPDANETVAGRFEFAYEAGPTTILDGFTIKYLGSDYGGAVQCYYCSPTISNNRFISNLAEYGGAIYVEEGSPIIRNNVFSSNNAFLGGAIYCNSASNVVIANNIFTMNDIWCDYSSGIILANNTITGCSTYAVSLNRTPATVSNNIIAYNYCGMLRPGGDALTLRNNCFFGNDLPNFGVTPGVGDITSDPKLVAADYGEVHLQSTSPCINAGYDTAVQGSYDIDGGARTYGAHVDIGADEYNGTVWTHTPSVVRVSTSGSDSNNGSTWALAKRTVQAAIDAAAQTGGEVWVAAGTYTGNVVLKPYVYLYGGFAGIETARAQRNWRANVCVLDGQKSGTVVDITGGYKYVTLDGFTVTNGSSGGVRCSDNAVSIRNNIIIGNSGGGIRSMSADIIIENNKILKNYADSGGGVYLISGSARLYNNVIAANTSTSFSWGGGIDAEGAGLTLINNTIVSNSADNAGALYTDSVLTACNNIMAFNSSGIYAPSGSTLLNNCVYNPDGQDYMEVAPGAYDIQQDPKLVSVSLGEYHLRHDSPCIDMGDDYWVQSQWTDIDGNQRVEDYYVDIGADEYDGTSYAVVPKVVRVSTPGNDSNSGSSWALAKRTVQAAIDEVALAGGEVWVAAGEYYEKVTLPPHVSIYGGFAGTETLRTQRNPVTNSTVLDGSYSGAVITVRCANVPCEIDGLTIRRGDPDGIKVQSCSPVISNCLIIDNAQKGINCYGASPQIIDCRVMANRYGIYCEYSNAVIKGNSISGNQNYGVQIDQSNPSILNNRITGSGSDGIYIFSNAATVAGNIVSVNAGNGIYMRTNTGAIVNNTITENTANAIYCDSFRGAIANNILAFNSSGVYNKNDYYTPALSANCIYNPVGQNYTNIAPGATDVHVDPKLVDVQWGKLHLRSDSPCINSGDDGAIDGGWTDIDGLARTYGGRIDIGADEYDGTAWSAQPIIIRVKPSGSDSNDGSSWALAKRTLQAAIDAASAAGGEVWVAAGTYSGNISLNPYVELYGGFAGTESTRQARNSESNVTIIDARQLSRAALVVGPGLHRVIDGFTLQNGKVQPVTYITEVRGAGIFCVKSSPTISNNILTGNATTSTWGYGGAIACSGGAPVISNNLMNLNNATYGAGVCCSGANATITGNRFVANTASQGGAIYCDSNATATISGNTIADNISASGAIYCNFAGAVTIANNLITKNRSTVLNSASAIYTSGSTSTTITNNTIADNTVYSSTDPAIACGNGTIKLTNNIIAFNRNGIYGWGSGSTTVNNNCIYNPDGYNYKTLTPGAGDIQLDPLFIDNRGNYHLRADSPCINAGINAAQGLPAIDFDGSPRIWGGVVDIGIYEFAAPSVAIADAKSLGDGVWTCVNGGVVTGVFSNFFYVESENRASGIRVNKIGHTFVPGQKVNVQGKLATTADFERSIDAAFVEEAGEGDVGALAMPIKYCGGADWLYDSATKAGQRGVQYGQGTNNIGLLVSVTGRVVSRDVGFFYIEDGSIAPGVPDPVALRMKVLCSQGVDAPGNGEIVSVTGISSCQYTGGAVIRVLRVHSADDIVMFPRP